MTRIGLLLLSAAALALPGAAADDPVWKPLLPDADFKALVEQAAKATQEELATGMPTTTSAKKARALAVMIAVYAQSTMNRPGADVAHLTGMRTEALSLADLIRQKKYADAGQRVAALRSPIKATDKAPFDLAKVGDRDELTAITMQLLAIRTRGGLGLESKPAKNLDGIEARLIGLGRKPLGPDELEKQAEEIARFAYVTAMIGEITHALAPEKDEGKKKRAEWIAWSEQMRDAGRQLAEASRAKNPKDVLAAAKKLNASCTSCHDVFRAVE
jgi:hypothetical protein